jgi:hypothetical protein
MKRQRSDLISQFDQSWRREGVGGNHKGSHPITSWGKTFESPCQKTQT